MGKVQWNSDAPGGLGAVTPANWFDSGCGTGPRARWLSDGTVEIEGEGVPVKYLPKDVPQWFETIAKYAVQYSVPAQLVAGVMATESGGQPKVHSYCCYGLMGLLPTTASGQAGRTVSAAELINDPSLNVQLGTKLLAELWKEYKGNIIRIAAAYNAGSPKCGGKKCPPNRWGLVADCVNGQAVDYSGRVIGFSNASVVGVGGAATKTTSSSSALWQILVGAVVVLPVTAIALGFWPGLRKSVVGAVSANPADVRQKIQKELDKQLEPSGPAMHGRYGAAYGQYNAHALDAGIETRQRYAEKWRRAVLELPGTIAESRLKVRPYRHMLPSSWRVFTNGRTWIAVSSKANVGYRVFTAAEYQKWLSQNYSVEGARS